MRRSTTVAVLAGSTLSSITGVAVPLARASAASARTYRGPTESYRYGTIAVTIKVKKGKLVSVGTTAAPDSERSIIIEQTALPELRSEALKTQRASINAVSGATLTSDAFAVSLAAALRHAHV